MALVSTLAILAAVGIAMPLDEIRVHNKINRNVNDMKARGGFRQSDIRLEKTIKSAIEKNWYGDKSFFPERLIPFLESDILARSDYIEGMTRQAVIAAGYSPLGFVLTNYNNLFTWDCFREYNSCHKEKEVAWFWEHYPEEMKAETERLAEETRIAEEAAKADYEKRKKRSWIGLGIMFGCVVPLILNAKCVEQGYYELGLFLCFVAVGMIIYGGIMIKKASG